MNVPGLQACRPALLESAADDLLVARRTVDAAGQDARAAARATYDGWLGEAGDSARAAADARAGRTDELVDTLHLVRRILLAVADALTAAKELLADGLALARRHDLVVTDDGTVLPPPPYLGAAGSATAASEDAEARFEAAADASVAAQAMIRQALGAAQEATSDAAAALRRAVRSAKDGSVHDGADMVSVQTIAMRDLPAPGTDPREVAAWWATLGPSAMGLAVARFPEQVGALDGVPVHYRDIANRRVLADSLAGAQREVAAAQEAVEAARAAYRSRVDAGAVQAALRDVARAEERLAMLQAIDVNLQGSDRHLMLVETTMPGRAAIAIGDVDTASHVAVVVPGLNSYVTNYMDKITNNASMVRDVADEALFALGRQESVATVAWIGYEAPGLSTVAFDDHAQAGAPLLTSTLWGIEANHVAHGTDVHLTTLGHSYGSLTSGLAATGDTPMDDLVLFGSPGVGVDHVRELALPADHVFVGEAKWDPVSDVNHFGSDPANPAFGAVTFQTDGGTHPLGGPTQPASGHSEYYLADTESLWNITSVVIGEPGSVTVGHTAGAGDFARGAWDGMGGQW